jgi:predicted transcriptional regulator
VKATRRLINSSLSEQVEIYSIVGGKAALEDVTLLLVYMTKNHKEIIADTKNNKLYVIISETVHTRNILDILGDIKMDEIPKKKPKRPKQNLKPMPRQKLLDL